MFLSDHWQRIAAGVLAGGMNQYAGAYLTERAEKKLAKEQKLRVEAERAALAALAAVPAPKPAAAAATPPRNAYATDSEVYGAVDRAHRAVDAMLWEERNNGYAAPYVEDERNGYGVPYADAIDVDAMEAYAA